MRFGGDPGDGTGQELSGDSQETIRALAEHMGLAPARTADQAREQGRQRLAVAGQRRYCQSWGDRMDNDPLVRRRAEQQNRAADFSNGDGDGHVLVGWDDGCSLPGGLTGLSWALGGR